MKDYYAILGVTPDVSARELKKVYRRMVKKWHPDFHTDNLQCEEKIKEINEAFKVLSDSKKRQEYDKQRKFREMYLARQMAFQAAKGDHPFFSFTLKMNERFGKKRKKRD